jgi:hypothetical protein
MGIQWMVSWWVLAPVPELHLYAFPRCIYTRFHSFWPFTFMRLPNKEPIHHCYCQCLEDCEANHYWAAPHLLLFITLFFFSVFCLDDLFDFFSFFGVLALTCVQVLLGSLKHTL